MYSSSQLRTAFISFFQEREHTFVPGASIVPNNDPSLLFTNAGMNQFKDIFLGQSGPLKRAVNSQICVRVSGKHNDLEDVGKDHTHLTSFEMLGNWSFGDYYKKEAIEWAWEFLTHTLSIPKNRLVATVFEEDLEAESLWKEVTDINPKHVVRCDAVDNFWEMGKTGPCGPCSELHVYLKDEPIDFDLDQERLNSGEFIELWNLVFIQFNRLDSGELEALVDKHVDTGAGFERLLAFLQNSSSNYDTDLFKPLIQQIETLSGSTYSSGEDGTAHRVCADHIRTLCFGIADNVFPSNEGRGYVLRRLLRRACRYAKQLGINDPFLYKLVPTVIATLGDHFEHLKEKALIIEKVVKAEEESFLLTLTSGIQLFEKVKERLSIDKRQQISGEDAFKLYDTFGFPIDLTQVMSEEAGLTIDLKRFHELLDQQKQRSREASSFTSQTLSEHEEQVTASQFEGLPLHLAENLNVAKGGEARIISNPQEKLGMARHHTATHIIHEVLRRQLGDHVFQAGSLVDSHRLRFDFSHFESLTQTELDSIESDVNAVVQKSMPITIKHCDLDTAKGMGALALFGEKYDESNVRVVSLSDFSIELCAGTHVQNTSEVERVKLISETAISSGTRRIEALAGNTVISQYLQERLQKEKEVLLTALNKENKFLDASNSTLQESLQKLKNELNGLDSSTSNDVLEKQLDQLSSIKQRLTELSKKIKKLSKQKQNSNSQQLASELKASIQSENNFLFLSTIVEDKNMNELRQLADQLVGEQPSLIAVLGSEQKDKGMLVIRYGKELQHNKLPANQLMDAVTSRCGGGGGGRLDMAQAGGISSEKLSETLSFAHQELVDKFK